MKPTIPPVPRPKLLLTRPQPASERFAAELRDDGAGSFDCVISPLVGIVASGPLPDLSGYMRLIFTSANAVEAYADLGGPSGLSCFTVGDATALAAENAGLVPRSAGGDADALASLIRRDRPAGPLLHLRGTHARGDLAERLTAQGILTDEAVIYDQPLGDLSPEAQTLLGAWPAVIVPLFSPRSAARFAETAGHVRSCWIVAMSDAVAQAMGVLRPDRLMIAAHPTGAEMRKTVAMLMDEARTLEGKQA